MSLFASVQKAPENKIFNLNALFKADSFPQKLNLGVGAYRDSNGKPYVFDVVKSAETHLYNATIAGDLNKEYLPIRGDDGFTRACGELLYGADSIVFKEKRIASVQSISGTGVNTTDGTTAGSLGGLGSATNGVNTYTPITASQLTAGDAYSFSASYLAGDTVATSLTVGEVSPFGDLTSTAAGTAGNLAGTIDTKNDITLVAGSAGTTVTGQFVVGLTLD